MSSSDVLVKPAVRVPFNKPFMTGRELTYIAQAHANGHLAGNGEFSKRCGRWLEERVGVKKALLTHSCTAALEMAAILSGVGPGDEVVMPSYTFVSTANAFVLRGAVPVFVDVRPDTLNIDETKIEAAITPKTRAIVALHYAGVACEMDAMADIASRRKAAIVEDAAQGIAATYKGRPLGSIGRFGALSFHETKNVIAGEGGALLLNDPADAERAEILWEKGTNRSQFFRGLADKYTWLDVGSSYLPSELTAAFLLAQCESVDRITTRRLELWRRYHEQMADLEASGALRRPVVPADCQHNGHIYYVLMPTAAARDAALTTLRAAGIDVVFHYVPLHSAPAGRRFGRTSGSLDVTDDLSARLIRLPLWWGMRDEDVDMVVDAVRSTVVSSRGSR